MPCPGGVGSTGRGPCCSIVQLIVRAILTPTMGFLRGGVENRLEFARFGEPSQGATTRLAQTTVRPGRLVQARAEDLGSTIASLPVRNTVVPQQPFHLIITDGGTTMEPTRCP